VVGTQIAVELSKVQSDWPSNSGGGEPKAEHTGRNYGRMTDTKGGVDGKKKRVVSMITCLDLQIQKPRKSVRKKYIGKNLIIRKKKLTEI